MLVLTTAPKLQCFVWEVDLQLLSCNCNTIFCISFFTGK